MKSLRSSETVTPQNKKLMDSFGLEPRQAEAILEIKLRHLAKLEEIRITAEKDELEKEKSHIEKTLGSQRILTNLIKKEIRQDIKRHGDERRSPIKTRQEAEAFSEIDVIPMEPVTIILSQNGWIRSAKGHDIDPEKLKFKTGDSLLAYARTMSNKQIAFLDSSGRSFSVYAHTLPSARGMGEPLTGRFVIGQNAVIKTMISGKDNELILLFSDTGFGFIV